MFTTGKRRRRNLSSFASELENIRKLMFEGEVFMINKVICFYVSVIGRLRQISFHLTFLLLTIPRKAAQHFNKMFGWPCWNHSQLSEIFAVAIQGLPAFRRHQAAPRYNSNIELDWTTTRKKYESVLLFFAPRLARLVRHGPVGVTSVSAHLKRVG